MATPKARVYTNDYYRHQQDRPDNDQVEAATTKNVAIAVTIIAVVTFALIAFADKFHLPWIGFIALGLPQFVILTIYNLIYALVPFIGYYVFLSILCYRYNYEFGIKEQGVLFGKTIGMGFLSILGMAFLPIVLAVFIMVMFFKIFD